MSVAYWQTDRALRHITPGNDRQPEGPDFPRWLAGILGTGRVLEFGCGTGRLASGFPPARYIGVDVSLHALALARAALPHDFRQVGEDDLLPEADAAFAHTVLLHVSDEALPAVVGRLCAAAPRVLVSEIMDRRWRRRGNPPVYNREPEEYRAVFAAAGMAPGRRWDRPYHRYGGVSLTALEFLRESGSC